MEVLTVNVDGCPTTAPNVFTPNGDGVNDLFTFTSEGMQSLHCRIYNRWGNLIYEWNDVLQGWDGTNMHNGKLVSDGVYYYIADVEDATGEVHQLHGFIQVLQ
jgi:gliding motility-associated-like protein